MVDFERRYHHNVYYVTDGVCEAVVPKSYMNLWPLHISGLLSKRNLTVTKWWCL